MLAANWKVREQPLPASVRCHVRWKVGTLLDVLSDTNWTVVQGV